MIAGIKNSFNLLMIVFILWMCIITINCASTTNSQPAVQPTPEPQIVPVRLEQKDGDSCIVTKQCKVIVSKYFFGQRRYFRCLIKSDYYQVIPKEGEISVDTNKCEEITP